MIKIPIKLSDKVLHSFLRAGRKFLSSRIDILDLNKVEAFIIEKGKINVEAKPSLKVKVGNYEDIVYFLSPEKLLIRNENKNYDVLVEIKK